MTEAEYIAVPRRDTVLNTPFIAQRSRNGAVTQFLLPQGSRLSFASMADSSLEIPFAPTGFFQTGDVIAVFFKGTLVFYGLVWTVSDHSAPGAESYISASVKATEWVALSNTIYRQRVNTADGYKYSSHVVLNATENGQSCNLRTSILAVLNYARAAGILDPNQTFSVSNDFTSVTLPFDECRDLTCADILRRLLRFFPLAQIYIRYNAMPGVLTVSRASTGANIGDYSHIVSSVSTSQLYPVSRVDLELETVNSSGLRTISHQKYPAQSTDSDNGEFTCLYASLRLAGAEASVVNRSFTAKGEAVGDYSASSWWIARHPRLNGIPAAAVTISGAARSDAADIDGCVYISQNSAPEIDSAGLKSHVAKFSCKASIDTTSDAEREIFLTVDYLVTNAVPDRTYSWTESSSVTAAETAPPNLARQIYEDRSSSLLSKDISILLDASFPDFSWRHGGLPLQSFEIDCSSLVAALHFGRPSHLSVDDMASLLSGFRNKARTHTVASIASGKPKDDSSLEVSAGVTPPLSSSEWQPGTKSKTTFSASDSSPSITIDASSTSGGSIDLSTSSVPSGQTVAPHTLTIGTGTGATTITVLASSDASISGGSGGGVSPAALNGLVVVTSIEQPSSSNNYCIVASRKRITASSSSISVASYTSQSIPTTPLSSS